ncbi:MAG: hypothetical protein KBD78_04245 [Oligoflexales bacterium]|nr:hypothetical protein [Oligoflexales bacterium]
MLTISALIGGGSFLFFHGAAILDPKNVQWLLSGDPATHFFGWAFYNRIDSSLTLPSEVSLGYIYPMPVNMAYTDSLPIYSFIMSFISPTHAVVQYSGLWLLICFTLQGFFACKIAQHLQLHPIVTVAFTLFCIFQAAFVTRVAHLALCGHFLILAAIYLFLSETEKKRDIFYWSILLLFVSGVHPYLAMMVLFIALGKVVFEANISVRNRLTKFVFFISTCLGAFLFFGYFSVDAIKNVDAKIGYYGADLFSFVHSSDHSLLFPSLWKPRMGSYEGYSFLGFGLLILIAYVFYRRKKEPFLLLENEWIRKLAMLAFLLWIYALGSNIRVFGFWIVNLEFLYEKFNFLFGSFRATGRFIWPMLYLIILVTMVALNRYRQDKRVLALIVIAVFLQIIDVSKSLKRTEELKAGGRIQSSIYDKMEIIIGDVRKFKSVELIPPFIQPTNCVLNSPFDINAYIAFAYYALKTDAMVNSGISARKTKKDIEETCGLAVENFKSARYDPDSLYILDSVWAKEQMPKKALKKLKCIPVDRYLACYSDDV